MVRRVGFGNTESGRSKPTPAQPTKSDQRVATPAAGTKKPIGFGTRIFLIVFIGLWLTGWTTGIVFAGLALLDGGGRSGFFLIFWIVFAIAGWIIAVRALLALLRGKQLPGNSK